MSDSTLPRRGGFKQALRRYPYGEAALWVMFALSVFSGFSDNEAHLTAAGLFALSAIGVRATRQPRGAQDV